MRRIFLRWKGVENIKDKDAALKLWKRTNDLDDKEWIFFSKAAAACMLEKDVTEIVETTHPSEIGLVSVQAEGAIEKLLRVIRSR